MNKTERKQLWQSQDLKNNKHKMTKYVQIKKLL